jgi:predicted amidohydrolase
MPARAYDNTLFVAVCNQVGDNSNGIKFSGVTFVCDPKGDVIATGKYTNKQEMVIADLKADVLEDARRVPETFFRHFKRSNLG